MEELHEIWSVKLMCTSICAFVMLWVLITVMLHGNDLANSLEIWPGGSFCNRLVQCTWWSSDFLHFGIREKRGSAPAALYFQGGPVGSWTGEELTYWSSYGVAQENGGLEPPWHHTGIILLLFDSGIRCMKPPVDMWLIQIIPWQSFKHPQFLDISVEQ